MQLPDTLGEDRHHDAGLVLLHPRDLGLLSLQQDPGLKAASQCSLVVWVNVGYAVTRQLSPLIHLQTSNMILTPYDDDSLLTSPTTQPPPLMTRQQVPTARPCL